MHYKYPLTYLLTHPNTWNAEIKHWEFERICYLACLISKKITQIPATKARIPYSFDTDAGVGNFTLFLQPKE